MRSLFIVAFALAAAGPALAQSDFPEEPAAEMSGRPMGGQMRPPERENLAQMQARMTQMFNRLDANEDGVVDASELANARGGRMLARFDAAVAAAEDWNTYVCAHVYTPRAIQRCVRAGVRSIEHGQLAAKLKSGNATALRNKAQLVGYQGDAASPTSILLVNNGLHIDVQINRLRRKLEADPANPRYLQTVRGMGYRLSIE